MRSEGREQPRTKITDTNLVSPPGTENTENRIFAHSREIPRMGKLLVRILRRLTCLIER